MNRSIIMFLLCISAAICVTGCGAHRRVNIQKKTFLLEVEHPQQSATKTAAACFNIRSVRVAPAFSGSQLVYRTGDVSFEQDYYNTYLSPPDEQFDEIVSRWFRDSKIFVCQSSQPSDAITLESHLDELYTDFKDADNPAAVVTMHFYLSRYDHGCNCPVEILKKTYTVRKPLQPKPTPEDVVKALSQSVTQILLSLEGDIADKI